MTLLSDWEAAHARWVASWDLLGAHRGPCGLCGYPDARHRLADALVGTYIAGDPIEVVAEEFGRPVEATTEVVLAGLNAERARLAARMPRGRAPPAPAAPTPPAGTTQPGDA